MRRLAILIPSGTILLRPTTIATAVLALSACFAHASTPLTPSQVYAKVSKNVVVIEVADSQGKPRGKASGVIIAAGEVVTNCHVLAAGSQYSVRHLNATHPATRRYSDEQRDLCQMQSPALKAAAVSPLPTANAAPGDRVFAIGAPQGLELTISEGLVSGLRERFGVSLLQTTAAISPGSSGGGLFDDAGRLVGITTFMVLGGQNLNFAVPARYIAELPARHARAAASASSNAFSTEAAAGGGSQAQRPAFAETAQFIEDRIRAAGRSASLALEDGMRLEVLLRSVAVRDCQMVMEREVTTTWSAPHPARTTSEIILDGLRLNARTLSARSLEASSTVTLTMEKEAPFFVRRTFYPASKKYADSRESRLVIHLADAVVAERVTNALNHAISLCQAERQPDTVAPPPVR